MAGRARKDYRLGAPDVAGDELARWRHLDALDQGRSLHFLMGIKRVGRQQEKGCRAVA